MGKKLLLLLVIVIVGAGVVWGLMTISANKKPTTTQTNQNTNQNNSTTTSSQSSNTVKNADASSAKVKALLDAIPAQGATNKQLSDYSAQVAAVAVDSDTLDVTGCVPNPAVLHLKGNKTITIKNSDAVSHKITNGTQLSLDIPANSSKSTTVSVPSLGVFGYGCDGKINGIFFVTE